MIVDKTHLVRLVVRVYPVLHVAHWLELVVLRVVQLVIGFTQDFWSALTWYPVLQTEHLLLPLVQVIQFTIVH